MTPKEEKAFELGMRAMARRFLGEALRELAPGDRGDDPQATIARLVAERADAVAALRRVCRDHGDNDWADNLHLGDVIEKHLGRHLAS